MGIQITNYSQCKTIPHPASRISQHSPIFESMQSEKSQLSSRFLDRNVTVDFYLPPPIPAQPGLLLINDGQDLKQLGLESILNDLYRKGSIHPLLCVGIHAGAERKMEYGTTGITDYKGRGARAGNYSRFILEELIPFIHARYHIPAFSELAFAGFSLGGLSALDMVWSNPAVFSKAGVFSGSLWWRTRDKNDKSYRDATDRIMHQKIRDGHYHPGLKFFFECGAADEEEDRNNNGIIDSIDDTLDLISELSAKGYEPGKDIHYLQLDDGRHDVATWARAMPVFLIWGWGR